MTDVRTTYNSTVSSAESAKASTIATAELTRQEAINAVSCNVGTNLAFGASNSQIAAVKAANLAKLASLNLAEQTKQASLAVARDTLRNAGTDAGGF